MNIVASRRDWAAGIFGVANAGEGSGNVHTALAGLLGNLIAYAPHDNAGMIAVALEHGTKILLRPLVEQSGVGAVQLALGDRPFVEGFIHHQQTQPVAKTEKLR